MDTVKIGDKVLWRGAWGSEPAKLVTVEGLDVTDYPHEKYGVEVDEVCWDLVRQNRVVFSLDTGNWAYSSQISKP